MSDTDSEAETKLPGSLNMVEANLIIVKLINLLHRLKQLRSITEEWQFLDKMLEILQGNYSPGKTLLHLDSTENYNHSKKSKEKSIRHREKGNMYFKSKVFLKALQHYTKSIKYAEPDSEELALAYGNRSAVLFEKGYYRECLADIKRALPFYPVAKKQKLFNRQTNSDQLTVRQEKSAFNPAVPTLVKRNKNIPSASAAVGIEENSQYGRHIVARRVINPGEVILVEKPFACAATAAEPEVFFYCDECCQVSYNLIPCYKCSGICSVNKIEVAYCSEKCLETAFYNYHKYECLIMQEFGLDIIDWTATRASIIGVTSDKKHMEQPAKYYSDRYKEICNLRNHKESMSKKTLMFNIVGVARAYWALKNNTDIFEDFDIFGRKEKEFKSQMVKNRLVSLANSVPIRELDTEKNATDTINRQGLYSVLSMFNHACYNNVGHSFFGKTAVCRALRKIEKDEQCFINYGLKTMHSTRKRRVLITKHHYFTCTCLACERLWPRVQDARILHNTPIMNEIMTILSEASEHLNGTNRFQKSFLLMKTFKLMDEFKDDPNCVVFISAIEIFDRILLMGNLAHKF